MMGRRSGQMAMVFVDMESLIPENQSGILQGTPACRDTRVSSHSVAAQNLGRGQFLRFETGTLRFKNPKDGHFCDG